VSDRARDALRAGDVGGALERLQDDVRRRPQDVRLRVFLFQLLAVRGEWERAKRQLAVAADLDVECKLLAQAYGALIAAERVREQVFAGDRRATVLGEPPGWLGELSLALAEAAKGRHAAAAELRGRALEAAPAVPGHLDEVRFAWIADADVRLGPVVELVVHGRYFWAPMSRLARLDFGPVEDLRDLVWLPVEVAWRDGTATTAFTPTRYPGSGGDDGALALARTTGWRPLDPAHPDDGPAAGLGQRMWTTDAEDYGLLEHRSLVFDVPADDADGAGGGGDG
jgi:type VI secretion system protein ImpE